ncbi:MAG TPA: glycosyltransferase [Nodosilinea sp.]|nr:glycosyltransferase [Nodosilinea sp.]
MSEPLAQSCTTTVAYLVNQYPKVSHSFIRREIQGLEACGLTVHRFSIRSCAEELVDADDQAELAKTRVVLGQGLLGLAVGLGRVAVGRPLALVRGLTLAWQLSQKAERGLLYHLIYLAEACVLLGWLQTAEVDHVHAHFGTNSTTVVLLCRALGGPHYSFTVHGPEEFDKIYPIGLPEKLRQAKFVVAISSFGRSQLYRWMELADWGKVHIVRCGVDQSFLAEAVQPVPDVPVFVCVGRLTEQKGHLLLLEAVKRLADQGSPLKLVLVGDGELRSPIEALIEAYGLQRQVVITGWASNQEVRAHLLRARAMVLPSFAEGLPVVIMEALALGRPVISTAIAGIPELVETGVNGWLVVPGSVDSLVTAMEAALHSAPAQLSEMGRRGAERVARDHDARREAQTLARLFTGKTVDLAAPALEPATLANATGAGSSPVNAAR